MADIVGGVLIFIGVTIVLIAVARLLDSWLRALVSVFRRRRRPTVAGEQEPEPGADGRDDVATSDESAVRADALFLRRELGDFPSREELEADDDFEDAVERLVARGLPLDALLQLAKDGDRWVSRLALAAIAGREDLPPDWGAYVVRRLRLAPYDQAWLFLRTLEGVSEPVVGPVVTQLEHVHHRDVADLIAVRQAKGRETVTEETFGEHVPLSHAELIESLLDENEALLPEVREPFERWQKATIDLDFVGHFARIWKRPYDSPPALLVGTRPEIVEIIRDAVTADPREPLLLVGEHGVGKTALVRSALDALPPEWLVFEATASAVNAGAIYIGELEGRVQQIVQKLRGQKAVWVIPAFEETLYAGRYTQSPTGLLDHLLPHLEAGELAIVAEISPAALENLLAQRPQISSVFRAVRVRALDETDSISVASHSLAHDGLAVTATDQVLRESFELAQQFLPGVSAPGSLVRVVESAAELVADREDDKVETADVLATLAKISGLPLALLDAEEPLNLERVRSFFEDRVLGQRDAVECLVERIALIKAGLTDPTRPLGVFLFVGPTGTGKTELAKAFAELLFGSSSRLVRLDMTEYQTPDSLERLLSDTSVETRGAQLISSVRRDPFSVVLLDEFEKAAPPIWDLFLQVFDDGRLTDHHGRSVDFRRCVIILTSNIGSSIARGPALGFERSEEPFRPEAIERAVKQSFRPEFLNRLDRVVVFRPFDRPQMRALLEKELADAERRRGLRARPWAVEYDDSALEFLIDQGFSPELGARPLKRAVERHLLAPLAQAIVSKAVPEGDQFLFVAAPRGQIEVRFVDPDRDEPSPRRDDDRSTARDLDVRSLALSPRSSPDVTAFLLEELRRVDAAVEGDAVEGRKVAALEAVQQPGFWEDDGRFAVLAEAEYLDRLHEAFRTATRLADRLERSSRNGQGSSELVGLLATRLYVLGAALEGLADDAPFEAFLRIRPLGDADEPEGESFVDLLARMYGDWAERKGMGIEELEPPADGERVFLVRGLGAPWILAPEAGLHVLELASDPEERPDRSVCAVELVARAPTPDATPAAAAANQAFGDAPTPTSVVRRYRPGPSPLVRDAVRGYRTGRLDRVLAGDFDLF